MNQRLIVALTFSSGLLIGGGAGILVTNHFTKKRYEVELEEQIASVKEHYRIIRKEGELSDPETALAAANYAESPTQEEPENPEDDEDRLEKVAQQILSLGYERAQEAVHRLEAKAERADQKQSIFDQGIDLGPDGEPRLTDRPYIISFDEWNDPDEAFDSFDTATVTYYEGDDTLLDDQESIIPDVQGTVGYDNLHKFGVGSPDRNIVYVRNEQRAINFEVVRKEVSYAEWLGLDVPADKPKVRRMRNDD